jgi:LAO/AO transport system kinase
VPAERDPEVIADAVLAGERRAIARAITILEDERPEAAALAARLWPRAGRAEVIGITGPPGAGKSTLVGALVRRWRAQGRTVGVVAVDPSSPFSHGAVLGDRVRVLEHDADAGVFFRSMGSRGRLGGLGEGTALAAMVLDAAGFDVVLIETVGAGQSDVRIADLADVVVLALQPGSGDSVQAIKAGVMEIPDVIAITKADLPGLDAFRSELRLALGIDPERAPLLVEVRSLEGAGVPELVEAIAARRAALGDEEVARRRAAGLERELVAGVASRVAARAAEALREDVAVRDGIARLHAREQDPLAVARLLGERIGGESGS